MRFYSRNGKCLNCHEELPEGSEAFCSYECAEEYVDGYGDWLYEKQRDRELDEQLRREDE